MSSWPKTYDDRLLGEVVMLEDFQKLLDNYNKLFEWVAGSDFQDWTAWEVRATFEDEYDIPDTPINR